MTPAEFRATLKALGIRQIWLAERLGVSPNTVNRWARGELAVPQYAVFALSLIEQLAAEGIAPDPTHIPGASRGRPVASS